MANEEFWSAVTISVIMRLRSSETRNRLGVPDIYQNVWDVLIAIYLKQIMLQPYHSYFIDSFHKKSAGNNAKIIIFSMIIPFAYLQRVEEVCWPLSRTPADAAFRRNQFFPIIYIFRIRRNRGCGPFSFSTNPRLTERLDAMRPWSPMRAGSYAQGVLHWRLESTCL